MPPLITRPSTTPLPPSVRHPNFVFLGSELKIDENFEEAFSEEESSLISWANSRFTSIRVPIVKNWESLRSGIKIIRLLWALVPGLETSGIRLHS